jgi:hypothetical protein
MVIIKRIHVGSAAKVGAVVSMIASAIFGIFLFGLQALFWGALASVITIDTSPSFQASGGNLLAAFSLVTLCIFYVMYVIFAGIVGGIGGLIWAFAYNLTVGWVGGLEVDLEGDFGGKAKRRSVLDDIYE